MPSRRRQIANPGRVHVGDAIPVEQRTDFTAAHIVKPRGAAQALAAIRNADPSLLEWETEAQDVTGWVAAVEVVTEVGAPASVMELLNEKVAAARSALAAVKVSNKFGAKQDVLDRAAGDHVVALTAAISG